MDIATLGYAVDTSAVKAGTKDLDDHATAAKNAATAAQSFVDGQQKQTGLLGTATAGIRSQREEMRALAEAAAVAGGPLGQLISSSGLLYIGSLRLNPLIIATTVAFGALAKGISDAVEAYAKFEAVQASIGNALRLTGGASGQSIGSLNALTGKLSGTGTNSVSDIRSAESELLKYRSVAGQVFSEALQDAQALSNTGFVSLDAAAKAFGAALNDPINGLKALEDAGVHFSPIQEKMITDLEKHGQLLQAQQQILQIAAHQLGGANSNSANTLDAAYGRLTNSGTLLLESWGKQIADGVHLTAVINGLADAIQKANAASSDAEKDRQTIMNLAQGARAGTLVNKNGTYQLPSLSDALSQRGQLQPPLNADEWNDMRTKLQAAAAASQAAQEKIDAVNIALTEQAKTAGMTATQLKAYQLAQQAGVEGNSKATAAIAAQVNAIAAIGDTKDILTSLKEAIGNSQIEIDTFNMGAGAAAAYTKEMQALNDERAKGVTLSPSEIASIHNLAQAYGDQVQKVQDLKDAKQAADAVSSSMVDSFYDVVTGAKKANQAILDLTNSILKMVLQAMLAGQGPFAGAFGTNTGPGAGGIIGSLLKPLFSSGGLFKFANGGSFIAPAGPGALALPGFADGTDFLVPGSGGPDSKVTAFRVSPGERVTVTPPGRSSSGQVYNDYRSYDFRGVDKSVVASMEVRLRAVETSVANMPKTMKNVLATRPSLR